MKNKHSANSTETQAAINNTYHAMIEGQNDARKRKHKPQPTNLNDPAQKKRVLRVCRVAAQQDRSDPFVYDRLFAHLKNGIMPLETAEATYMKGIIGEGGV